jgi:L-rhamnose isomerase
MSKIEQAYELAKERYAKLSVDTDMVMAKLAEVPIRGFWSNRTKLYAKGIQGLWSLILSRN